MFIFSKIFTVLLIIWCIQQGKRESQIYNPFNLLIVTLVSFLVYQPHIGGPYLDDLTDTTSFFCLVNFCSLIAGFTICSNKNKLPIESDNISYSFLLVFVIGVIPTALSYYIYGNIFEMEGEEMLETRDNMTLPVISQLAYFLPASILVACNNDNTKHILLSVFFSALAALMTMSKTSMVIVVCYCALAFSKYNPSIMEHWIVGRLKKTSFIWLPVLLIGYFYYNTTKRIDAESQDYSSYIDGQFSKYEGGMIMNYLYLCSPWSNLNYDLQNQKPIEYGKRSFAQFAKKIGITYDIPSYRSRYFLNTHSYLMDFLLDFGFVGAIIASFFLGWLVYYLYARFGLSDDPLLVAYYVLVSYATVMLFFSNHFTIGYLLNYLITFGGVSLFTRKFGDR